MHLRNGNALYLTWLDVASIFWHRRKFDHTYVLRKMIQKSFRIFICFFLLFILYSHFFSCFFFFFKTCSWNFHFHFWNSVQAGTKGRSCTCFWLPYFNIVIQWQTCWRNMLLALYFFPFLVILNGWKNTSFSIFSDVKWLFVQFKWFMQSFLHIENY